MIILTRKLGHVVGHLVLRGDVVVDEGKALQCARAAHARDARHRFVRRADGGAGAIGAKLRLLVVEHHKLGVHRHNVAPLRHLAAQVERYGGHDTVLYLLRHRQVIGKDGAADCVAHTKQRLVGFDVVDERAAHIHQRGRNSPIQLERGALLRIDGIDRVVIEQKPITSARLVRLEHLLEVDRITATIDREQVVIIVRVALTFALARRQLLVQFVDGVAVATVVCISLRMSSSFSHQHLLAPIEVSLVHLDGAHNVSERLLARLDHRGDIHQLILDVLVAIGQVLLQCLHNVQRAILVEHVEVGGKPRHAGVALFEIQIVTARRWIKMGVVELAIGADTVASIATSLEVDHTLRVRLILVSTSNVVLVLGVLLLATIAQTYLGLPKSNVLQEVNIGQN